MLEVSDYTVFRVLAIEPSQSLSFLLEFFPKDVIWGRLHISEVSGQHKTNMFVAFAFTMLSLVIFLLLFFLFVYISWFLILWFLWVLCVFLSITICLCLCVCMCYSWLFFLFLIVLFYSVLFLQICLFQNRERGVELNESGREVRWIWSEMREEKPCMNIVHKKYLQ